MRYAKATGVGVLSAIAAAVLYLAIKESWASLYMALVLVPQAQANAESGSWDAYYPQSFDLRGPLVVGFVIGFWWMMRRRVRTSF